MHKSDPTRKASEAQTKANRENAQKSTGPRSPEGRAASSRNSLTHGLTANDHLLATEDPEEFLVLLKDLYDRFHPVGPGEEKLVQRIAGNQWRLDRAFAMEAGIFRNRLRELAEDFEDQVQDYPRKKASAEFQRNPVPRPPTPREDADLLAHAFDADCLAPDSLTKLARYETTIERSIDRCLRQLKAFQAARASQAEVAEPAETKPETSPQPASPPPPDENCEANPIPPGSAPLDPPPPPPIPPSRTPAHPKWTNMKPAPTSLMPSSRRRIVCSDTTKYLQLVDACFS